MMFRKRLPVSGLAVLVFAGAGAAAPSLAQTGFYVGATVGESIFHQDRSEADATVFDAFNANGLNFVSTSSFDKTDIAFGGLLGFRFTPNVAVEAAYVDLGKLKYKANGTVTNGFSSLPASATLTAKAKGPTIAALGILPLSPAWDVYGRAGVLFSKTTLGVDITVGANSGSGSTSGNSADPLVGVGAAWHLANRLTLRAEYTRYVNVGDKEKTGESNVDLINVGITYSFQ